MLRKVNLTKKEEDLLVVSWRLVADMMFNMASVEQKVRKFTEENFFNWAEDCKC